MTKRRVLVTGGTGFIGSHLTKALIDQGHDVAVIHRSSSDFGRIQNVLDKIQLYPADLRDTEVVAKIIEDFNPEAIFHLATYYAVNHKSQDIVKMVDTNVLGTINLLEAARQFGVTLFVNTSSCFVYQPSQQAVTEESPVGAINLYALTKLQAEDACSFYAKEYGQRCVTLRLFSPYGPSDHQRRLIPYIIKTFLNKERPQMTTGKQQWDFVYVTDIVDAYLKVLAALDLPSGHVIFNIGSGEATSVYNIGEELKEILEGDQFPNWGAIAHRPNELWFVCADITKANRILRWRPHIRILEQGLPLTVQYMKNFIDDKIHSS